MSIYQRTIAARERAKKIREIRETVLARISRNEDTLTIRNVLKFGKDGAP